MVNPIISPLYIETAVKDPIDVFGYLPVASPKTQTDIKVYHPASPEFYSSAEISGTNTTIDIQPSYVDIGVGTSVGKRILRSKNALSYQNGKAPTGILTGNFLSDEPNVIKRVGLCYNNDYIFLENENGQIRLHFSSDSLDAPDNDQIILRENWDDPIDGSGASQANIDLSRNFIFFVTFQYLGVGSLFCGVIVNSKRYLIHQFNKENSEIKPYWSTPNLFLHYEIEKTIAGGNTTSLRTICSTLINNDGADTRRLSYYLLNENSFTLNQGNRDYPVIVFRMTQSNSRIYISSPEALVNSNEFGLRILKNPTLDFTPSYTQLPNSSVEYQYMTSKQLATYSDPSQIVFASGGGINKSSNTEVEEFPVLSNANDVPDTYVVTVHPYSNGKKHLESIVKILEEV